MTTSVTPQPVPALSAFQFSEQRIFTRDDVYGPGAPKVVTGHGSRSLVAAFGPDGAPRSVQAADARVSIPLGGHVGRYTKDDRFRADGPAGIPAAALAGVTALGKTAQAAGVEYVAVRVGNDGADQAVTYWPIGSTTPVTTEPGALPAGVSDAVAAARAALSALAPSMTHHA
jgi:hypothetical protein